MVRKKETPPSFEESLETLEEVVTRLEQGHLSLEEALTTFEQGISLAKSCRRMLEQAEQRVTQLMTDTASSTDIPLSPTDDKYAK